MNICEVIHRATLLMVSPKTTGFAFYTKQGALINLVDDHFAALN